MALNLSLTRVLYIRSLGHLNDSPRFSSTSALRLAEEPGFVLPAPEWVRVANRLCRVRGNHLYPLFPGAEQHVDPSAQHCSLRIFLQHDL